MSSISDIEQQLTLLRARLSGPDAALLDLFLQRISRWYDDETTVEDLLSHLDRTLGNIWFSTNENHATVALHIARLRDTIASIGGMTMNERLYMFNLMDRWDHASDAERDVLYKKVLAQR